MFRTSCTRKKFFSPSSSDVDTMLSKIEKVLGQLSAKLEVYKTFPHQGEITEISKRVKELKEGTPGSGTDSNSKTTKLPKIPMKDGMVDKEKWDQMSADEKASVWETLDTAYNDLLCYNQDQLCVGRLYFLIFFLLLVALGGVYHVLHMNRLGQPRLSSQQVTSVWEQARKVELMLGKLKGKKDEKEIIETKNVVIDELKRLKGFLDVQGERTTENSEGQAKAKTENADSEKQKNPVEAKTASESKAGRLPLPFETSRLLGTVSAEAEQNDPTVHQTYQEFLKHLKADLESFSTVYLWTALPWRWFELAFWAAIGCLVGLVFYIAGSLIQGIFRTEEVWMFWAEVLIAPIVVPIILLAFADAANFAPNEASVIVNVGVAFIFGFAIRRTIGLLDIIKKRFFPDPSPSGAGPGS